MLIPVLTLLAVAPPTGFTVSMERVAVTRTEGVASVVVDPLAGEVKLEGLALAAAAPGLCPTMKRTAKGVTLTCTTRRVWAELQKDARGAFVDLREVAGVSWADVALVPVRAFSLRTLLLPDSCPGTLPAARAECALSRGEPEQARVAWTECLTTPDQGICHLRLGDLDLREGHVEAALAHYARVNTIGPAGTLARLRTCELLGTCLGPRDSERAAEDSTLTAELSREVRLSAVRRELVAGRDARAMQWLVRALERDPQLCVGALPLCQKLVATGLRSTDAEARIGALSTFLAEPIRTGPAQYELNVAAADAASDLGAPAFAASVLSANTPRVPKAELGEHLLRIVNLYLVARDPVRAAVVLEYAEGKLGGASGARWTQVRRQLGRRAQKPVRLAVEVSPSLEALSSDVALTTDLARATALRSKAADSFPPENAP